MIKESHLHQCVRLARAGFSKGGTKSGIRRSNRGSKFENTVGGRDATIGKYTYMKYVKSYDFYKSWPKIPLESWTFLENNRNSPKKGRNILLESLTISENQCKFPKNWCNIHNFPNNSTVWTTDEFCVTSLAVAFQNVEEGWRMPNDSENVEEGWGVTMNRYQNSSSGNNPAQFRTFLKS